LNCLHFLVNRPYHKFNKTVQNMMWVIHCLIIFLMSRLFGFCITRDVTAAERGRVSGIHTKQCEELYYIDSSRDFG